MVANSARYELIQRVIDAPKVWTASFTMRELWSQAIQRRFPKPFFFRVTPEIQGEAVEGIFVDVRYKQTHVPGNRDTLNFSLIVDGVRALGLDDNGPSNHQNTVGEGLPYYRRIVDHPHLNLCLPTALSGYAEPLEPASAEDLWTVFVQRANILRAPSFMLPIGQTEFPI